QFTVAPGQALLLWPGRKHGGTTNYKRELSFYWIHFYLSNNSPQKKESAQTLQIPQLTTLRDADRLTALLRRFLDDQESGRLKPLPASLLILQMLCEVAAAAASNDAASAPISALAGKVEAHIRANFHRELSTASVAGEFQCNPDYLGRIFKRVNGRTIVEFIHDCRMRHAQRLLIESALNIDQVARDCGFEDSGYFRRIFNRHTGLSPRKFRRLHARVYVNTE
ncbi:MAG TPA: helix-turn-helix transcriptional regulator, partial [Planctomycetota bacterium]|nr:helix-turn-helix transcriptional regulator [Planctomycetota bacterium]